jgi:hypothetical protein
MPIKSVSSNEKGLDVKNFHCAEAEKHESAEHAQGKAPPKFMLEQYFRLRSERICQLAEPARI